MSKIDEVKENFAETVYLLYKSSNFQYENMKLLFPSINESPEKKNHIYFF